MEHDKASDTIFGFEIITASLFPIPYMGLFVLVMGLMPFGHGAFSFGHRALPFSSWGFYEKKLGPMPPTVQPERRPPRAPANSWGQTLRKLHFIWDYW
jgi:hypothetical protein